MFEQAADAEQRLTACWANEIGCLWSSSIG